MLQQGLHCRHRLCQLRLIHIFSHYLICLPYSPLHPSFSLLVTALSAHIYPALSCRLAGGKSCLLSVSHYTRFHKSALCLSISINPGPGIASKQQHPRMLVLLIAAPNTARLQSPHHHQQCLCFCPFGLSFHVVSGPFPPSSRSRHLNNGTSSPP